MMVLIASEVLLRIVWGFCDAPLVLESDRYEYIYAPNQKRYRFGNHINYNQYSMRGTDVDSIKLHILGLGDSVINGGVAIDDGADTDESELATTIVSNQTGIQVLNISAGSWGPDNCAAYLKEKGLFNAKALILVTSSHDAHDMMNFQKVVDIHPSYPSKQYQLAYLELMDRYLLPRLFKFFDSTEKIDPDQAVIQGIQKKGIGFNPGFDALKDIADSAGIPFLIYLHPETSEIELGKYNSQGEEIINWALKNDIYLMQGVEEKMDLEDYIDIIHMNEIGQRKLAINIKKLMQENDLY